MTDLSTTLTVTTTRPADTTAYAAGDVIGESPATVLVFTGPEVAPGANLIITGVSILTMQASIPAGLTTKRLHLFRRRPTPIVDNAAFDVIANDRSNYVGYLDIPAPVQIGSVYQAQNAGQMAVQVKLDRDERALYAVVQTVTGYTPAASVVRQISISVFEV